MAIASVGMVQTLEPARPLAQAQAIQTPQDQDRDDRNRLSAQPDDTPKPRRSPPEPGKGGLVDRTA